MSRAQQKLADLQSKIKQLEAEEAKIIEARRLEVATLIEKIPGLLELENIVIAGIIFDGVSSLKSNPAKAEHYKEQAYNLPSFRKPKRKQVDEDQATPNVDKNEVTA